jgi:transposase-like protein
VSVRVSPIEGIRDEIHELFGSGRQLTDVLEDVARLSVRLVIQSVWETEVASFLERDRYQRREEGSPVGSRNGYQPPSTIKTTLGAVEVRRPKLRNTLEPFASQLFGAGVTRTNALETLVIAGWVRGMSDRDVEAALAETLGPDASVSKSTVSRICERLRHEFAAWNQRRLDDVELDYLFLDGSHFRYHDGADAEPVFAAWGITTAGKPVLVGLTGGASESTDAWGDFLAGLIERGLRCPLLVISDGAPGLIAAVQLHYPRARRQRCAIHRARNILAKVSKADQAAVKADYWKIFDVDAEPGAAAIRQARANAKAFSVTWRKKYPGAVECLERDLGSLFEHLRFPVEHWKRIRHSNFIERSFGETRRRVKVIGRLPGETSCLTLVWAVLDRASHGWRGFSMSTIALRRLQDLRREHLAPTIKKEAVATAA